MRTRLLLLALLATVAAACGDGGELRPYPAPPLSSPDLAPEEASTTSTVDPRLRTQGQSVVILAADMPGFADAPPTTTTSTTSTTSSSASSTSSTTPPRKQDDVDFAECKATAVQRLLESPAAVNGPTLRRGTGDESAEVASVAVFGSQSDATAAIAEIGSAEVANCMATQLAGKASTAQVTAPRVEGIDEAKQIEMTVPRPTGAAASRNVKFVFLFLREADGFAAAVYRAPTTVVRAADQNRVVSVLGTKLAKAAAPAAPAGSSTSSAASSSTSTSRP